MDPIEVTTDYYNKHAQTGWIDRKTNSFYLEEQFSSIAPLWPENSTILDIGCAAGLHAPLFFGLGRHVMYHGLDTSETFLQVARRRYPQLPFTLGSITDESLWSPNQFGGFWANSVLMHVPYSEWSTLFTHLETICQSRAYGYLSLPTAHPNPAPDDTRHFTLRDAGAQRSFLQDRQWKIIKNGIFDGFTTAAIWHWYIVQLPSK